MYAAPVDGEHPTMDRVSGFLEGEGLEIVRDTIEGDTMLSYPGAEEVYFEAGRSALRCKVCSDVLTMYRSNFSSCVNLPVLQRSLIHCLILILS